MPLFARHFPVVVAGRVSGLAKVPLVLGPDILRSGLGERHFGASLVPGPFLDISKWDTFFFVLGIACAEGHQHHERLKDCGPSCSKRMQSMILILGHRFFALRTRVGENQRPHNSTTVTSDYWVNYIKKQCSDREVVV